MTTWRNRRHRSPVLDAANRGLGVYGGQVTKAAREVRGVRKSPVVERIFLPGEREALLRDERRRT